MGGRPRVSIVVPVYNGERFIAEAIASIRRQGIDSLEIVVVDDGSTDGTTRLLARDFPECRCLSQPRAGPAAARNAGIAAAHGSLIGFLDSDDTFAEHGLTRLDAALAAAPNADMAMGMVRAMQAVPSCADRPATRFEPSGEAVICYNVGSMLVRRAVFERVGVFDAQYRHCEDVDWFMRAQEAGVSFEMLRDVVLHYRRHDANMSLDGAATALALAKVLKASLDRRRALPGSEKRSLDEVYYVRPGRMRV